jgi:ribonuclease P protein component
VGIVVAKRGRTTTDRNRLKRRLRELTRLRLLPILQPVDLVVQARPEAYDATFVELEAQLLGAIERILRILREKSPETM